MMEIQPPPDYPPICPSDYPQVPTRTPPATLQTIHALCVYGDIQKFREVLDSACSSSEGFDIRDLSAVMTEAIKRNNVQFIQELLHRGVAMNTHYALEAIKAKAKDTLEVILDNGWDINQPISELRPPVLG